MNKRDREEVLLNAMEAHSNGDGNGTHMNGTGTYRDFNSLDEVLNCRRKIRPKTDGQATYIETIDSSVITLCSGPAGTGKTFIAVAKAIDMLLDNEVKNVLFVRPTVECGSKLGFLPGEIKLKIEPYMKPIMYTLAKFLHKKQITNYIESEIIELAPLAYMRGMTYDKTILVLDEAQNATYEELKMFLTRLGQDSRMIVCGDTTQRDLTGEAGKAFDRIIKEFDHPPYIDGIGINRLTIKDIVRSGIVQKIVERLGE